MNKTLSRRRFIGRSLATCSSLALSGTALSLAGCGIDGTEHLRQKSDYLDSLTRGAGREMPNIILIYADDMGYGDLGCFGSRVIKTPHIDRLAREGITMTDFYACAPQCSPSRAGILTGRYPVRTGVNDALMPSRSFFGIGQRLWGITEMSLPEDEICISEILKNRGYATGIIGKWHLGDRAPSVPNDRGFDFFYGAHYSNDMKPFAIYRNRKVEIEAPADQTTLTKRYTDEAISFIKENSTQPFFLYFAHTFPHVPLYASENFRNRSKGGRYGDTIEEIDWSVGEVMRTLKEQGLDKNTLVIFTSDNGPWVDGSTGRHRGRKFDVFETGFRVPFIARWKGKVPAGITSQEPAMNLDIFPTILRITGTKSPGDRIIDGRDMLPLMLGRGISEKRDFHFYWREHLWALRRDTWKYHRKHQYPIIQQYPWPEIPRKGPLLYNLEDDPGESYSLIRNHPDVAKKMATRMDRWDRKMKDNPRGWLK